MEGMGIAGPMLCMVLLLQLIIHAFAIIHAFVAKCAVHACARIFAHGEVHAQVHATPKLSNCMNLHREDKVLECFLSSHELQSLT